MLFLRLKTSLKFGTHIFKRKFFNFQNKDRELYLVFTHIITSGLTIHIYSSIIHS